MGLSEEEECEPVSSGEGGAARRCRLGSSMITT